MGASKGDDKYILVIKDDASKFVWFLAVPDATAEMTYSCLMEWFATFGVCSTWVSDQGTHFKKEVIKSLQHVLGAHHHFTTARCPWANGTVDVVMREALRCFCSLLSEWKMSPKEWPCLTKVVQLVLSHTPAASLGGQAPVTDMTGLPAMSPLDAIVLPTPLQHTTLSALEALRQKAFEDLRVALDEMHRMVSAASSAARSKGLKSHRKAEIVITQYHVGDYVLYADVWAHTRAN
ncbi:Integrase core domain [Phytophthora infestans]|uniref:Integrase core domain n=1 Tax=Phytophthora infestans TaxID=4787 RepID=A0A8S9TIX0_PHYIN|nr:Integrase core domain [Phytophthora infestans]